MPTLTFIESLDRYSIYSDSEGNDVYLAHGPGFRRLVDSATLDLWELWHAESAQWRPLVQSEFLARLRTLVIDPYDIDDIRFCAECASAHWYCNMPSETHCESCYDAMEPCENCGERENDLTYTLSGGSICDYCRDNDYSFCDDCNSYYHDNYSSEHDHARRDCCESPALTFAVRNGEDSTLRNDTRAAITLPSGEISDDGIAEIARAIRVLDLDISSRYAIVDALGSIGTAWQTRQGNYTKRLSRLAYTLGVKLPPEFVSRIGCIARDHSRSVDVEIDVTRDLNLPAGDFYHEGSCWWGGYAESRCALKTNGGYGLRSFEYGNVSGRAWVMPLLLSGGALCPTFDALAPDAFVVFNGYGALEGFNAARIVAHMAGMTYRKISFSCSPMYINAGGYLVASEDIAQQFADNGLHLTTDDHSDLYCRGDQSYVA